MCNLQCNWSFSKRLPFLGNNYHCKNSKQLSPQKRKQSINHKHCLQSLISHHYEQIDNSATNSRINERKWCNSFEYILNSKSAENSNQIVDRLSKLNTLKRQQQINLEMIEEMQIPTSSQLPLVNHSAEWQFKSPRIIIVVLSIWF